MTTFFYLPGSGVQVGSAGGAATISPASGGRSKTARGKELQIFIAARACHATISDRKHPEIVADHARPAIQKMNSGNAACLVSCFNLPSLDRGCHALFHCFCFAAFLSCDGVSKG
jgi:hypothetical protein